MQSCVKPERSVPNEIRWAIHREKTSKSLTNILQSVDYVILHSCYHYICSTLNSFVILTMLVYILVVLITYVAWTLRKWLVRRKTLLDSIPWPPENHWLLGLFRQVCCFFVCFGGVWYLSHFLNVIYLIVILFIYLETRR